MSWQRRATCSPCGPPRKVAQRGIAVTPLHPAVRECARRLSVSAYGKVVEDFEATQAELVLIGIDEALARQAGDLAEEFKLRGYDAVHLASALALGAFTTVVTWDDDLGRAAIASGCGVAPSP